MPLAHRSKVKLAEIADALDAAGLTTNLPANITYERTERLLTLKETGGPCWYATADAGVAATYSRVAESHEGVRVIGIQPEDAVQAVREFIAHYRPMMASADLPPAPVLPRAGNHIGFDRSGVAIDAGPGVKA